MNCTRFRFLIQQRFDVDLPTQDARSLVHHVESCESCAKFDHQLDQMIQAALEVPLPDELQPPSKEQLAATIQRQLPEAKGGVFSVITKIFGGAQAAAAGGKEKKGKSSGKAANLSTAELDSYSSAFPHRAKNAPKQSAKELKEAEEEAQSQRSRLERSSSLEKTKRKEEVMDNREMQSRTGSLGERLNVSVPLSGQMSEDQPLTLAESIRRKISESQKMSAADMEQIMPPGDMGQEGDGSPGNDGWSKPISLPVKPGTPEQGQAKPEDGWNMPGATKPQGAWGGSWDDGRPPRGTDPGVQADDWGPPPQGGSWDGPDEPQQGQQQQQQAPGGVVKDSWGQPPSDGKDSWGPAMPAQSPVSSQAPPQMPPTPPAKPATNQPTWGSPPEGAARDAWGGGGAQPDAWGNNPPGQQGDWGSPPAPGATKSGDSWGAPPGQGGNSWGTPPQGADGWGAAGNQSPQQQVPQQQVPQQQVPQQQVPQQQAPAAAQTQEPVPQAKQDAWGGAGSPDGGWSQAAGDKPRDSWGAPQPAQTKDAWGQPAPGQDSWSQGGPGQGQNNAWGQPPQQQQPAQQQQAPAPQEPVPANKDAWGQPKAQEAWGQPPAPVQPAPAPAPAPAPQAPPQEAWGQPSAPPKNEAWGQPPSPQGNQPPAGNEVWGNAPAPNEPPSPVQPAPAKDAWGQPAPADAWGQPGASQQQPPQQQQAPEAPLPAAQAPQKDAWGQPIPATSWGQPPQDSPAGASGDSWNQPPSAQKQDWEQPQPLKPGEPAKDAWGQTPPKEGWAQAGGGEKPGDPWTTPSATKESWASPGASGGGTAVGSWGTSAKQPDSDKKEWGGEATWGDQPKPKPAEPAQAQTQQLDKSTWAQPPGEQQQDAWTQQRPQTQAAWGANPNPNSQAPNPAGKPQGQGWGGQPPQPQAEPAPGQAPTTTAGWGEPTNDWGGQHKPSWSAEAEQIETGTWQAFTPNTDALAPKEPRQLASPQSFAPEVRQPQQTAAQRWDVPIQERSGAASDQWGGTPQPAPAAPPQPAPAAPPQPAPQPAPSSQSGVPTDRIFERLGEVLSEEGKKASPTENRWDVPIQERKPQEPLPVPAPQPVQAPTPAPSAQPDPVASGWDIPVTQKAPETLPAAKDWTNKSTTAGSAWGSGGQSPASAWGATEPAVQPPQPTAAPTTGWGAPSPPVDTAPPVDAAPPAKPSPSAWESAPSAPAGAWGQTTGGAWGSAPQSQPQPPEPAQPPSNGSAWGAAPTQPTWSAAPTPAATPAPDNRPAGLFNIDDNAIDKLFSENLGVKDTSPLGGKPAQPAPPAVPTPQPPVQPQPQAQSFGAPAPTGFGAPAPTGFGASSEAWGAPAPPANGDQMQEPRISAVPPRAPGSTPEPPMPMMPQPMAPPVAAPAAPTQMGGQSKSGLFSLDDREMDRLFSQNLGVNEATPAGAQQQPAAQWAPAGAPSAPQQAPMMAAPQPSPPQPSTIGGSGWGTPTRATASGTMPTVSPQPSGWAAPSAPATMSSSGGGSWGAPQPGPTPTPMAPLPPQPQPTGGGNGPGAGGGGLFAIDDGVIDRIFETNLGVIDSGMPKKSVNSIVQSISDAALPPPKIEGIGRLDPKMESQDSGSGRIASIGKFLLDQKDLEKIGKITATDLNDSKMRILTLEASQELQSLLLHIGAQPGVVGSVIVGHDGLLIANTMPQDMDAESVGVWALGVYMNTEHVIRKMGHERVHQVVSKTPRGYLVIADFGGGLLVTVTDGRDTDTLIPLMRSITQLVA